MPEEELVSRLAELPPIVDAIVLHPDQIEDPMLYAPLDRRLLIENMDSRKASGRFAPELAQLFEQLPAAGFCFDIAHAWTVDPTMRAAENLLDSFATRLRHVHLSSMSDDLAHVPLSTEQEGLFAPLLSRCSDVPWILEAEPPER
jgi:sugar phosphate isomerase/epimerase